MNGQQNILAMRRAGFKPAFVWLQDSGLVPSDLSITLSNTDIPEALDLRPLVGVTVLAESDDRKRLARMLVACEAAKAKRVITTLYKKTSAYGYEILETTDTLGILTWPT